MQSRTKFVKNHLKNLLTFDLAATIDCDIKLFLGDDFGALSFGPTSVLDLPESFSDPFEDLVLEIKRIMGRISRRINIM